MDVELVPALGAHTASNDDDDATENDAGALTSPFLDNDDMEEAAAADPFQASREHHVVKRSFSSPDVASLILSDKSVAVAADAFTVVDYIGYSSGRVPEDLPYAIGPGVPGGLRTSHELALAQPNSARRLSRSTSSVTLVDGIPCVPQPRYGHVAVVDERRSRMVVFGGNNLTSPHNADLYLYYFDCRLWYVVTAPQRLQQGPAGRQRRAVPRAAEARDEGAEVPERDLPEGGGEDGRDAPERESTRQRPNQRRPGDDDLSVSWPQGRHFHSAVEYHGSMYVFGGKSNGYMNDVWRLDLDTLMWFELHVGGMKPSQRYGHSACVYQRAMYILGGYDAYGLPCNDLWRFDFVDHQWFKVPTIGHPPERFHHTAVVHDGSMYVFGGKDGNDGKNDIQEYRFGSRSWSAVHSFGPTPERRWGHSAVAYSGKMWVLGGCDSVINYSQLLQFDFYTSTWSVGDSSGYDSAYFQSPVVYDHRLFVFGGKNVHNYTFNELYECCFGSDEQRRQPNTFVTDFRRLLYSDEYSDVTFEFPNEGKEISGHRNVLYARCPVFRQLMQRAIDASAAMTCSSDGSSSSLANGSASPSSAAASSSAPTQQPTAPAQSTKASTSKEGRKETKSPRRSRKDSALRKQKKRRAKRKEEWPEVHCRIEDDGLCVVRVLNVSFEVYRAMLEYIYTATFEISTPAAALELFRLSSKYGLQHLQELTAASIGGSLTVDNVVDALELSVECEWSELTEQCVLFIIRENLSETLQQKVKNARLDPKLRKRIVLGISAYRMAQEDKTMYAYPTT